jgi:CRISPR-associated protein (TIGR03986 family)
MAQSRELTGRLRRAGDDFELEYDRNGSQATRKVRVDKVPPDLVAAVDASPDDPPEVTVTDTASGVVDVRAAGTAGASARAAAEPPPDAPQRAQGPTPDEPRFRNPYGFVPKAARTRNGPLADGDTPSRGALHEDRWTGSLEVELEVETPLFLADASRSEVLDGRGASAHLGYPTVTMGGVPCIPGSSLKGALRSAFEMVTSSRFGVFGDEHRIPLARRMPAKVGLRMVPARVEHDGHKLRLRLLPGSSPLGSQHAPNNVEPLYAAWVPRYLGRPPVLTDNSHGQRVTATVELVRRTGSGPAFSYWCVVEPQHPAPSTENHSSTGQKKTVTGWLCVTGQNIGKKHDERLFFSEEPEVVFDLDDRLRQQWSAVIKSYSDAHDWVDVWERKDGKKVRGPEYYLGGEPGKTAWSRHQWERANPKSRRAGPNLDLADGDLVYALLPSNVRPGAKIGAEQVKGLFPVQIAREPFERSPFELGASQDLLPATKPAEQSATDRLFGWVSQSGGGDDKVAARASRVRVHATEVVHEPEDGALETFKGGLPLGILAQPKPSRAEFYTRPAGSTGAGGYTDGGVLAGAKVYVHNPGGGRATAEMRTPYGGSHDDVRTHQNRSVLSWVRPGTRFSVRIDVLDAAAAEVGALLYLLSESPRLRVGGAKPLGLGSLRVKVVETGSVLCTGTAWAQHWSSAGSVPLPGLDADTAGELVDQFKSALDDLVGAEWAERVLASYSGAVDHASTAPVHYPRHPDAGGRDGQNYGWFVRGEVPQLPQLHVEDPTLPVRRKLPDKDRRGGGRR